MTIAFLRENLDDSIHWKKKELEDLTGLSYKKSASLVVIRGRKRVGKRRLAEEFSKSFSKRFFLSGIPPEKGVTALEQRHEFLRQLQEHRLPIYKGDDWGDLFYELSQNCQKGRILIVLDEITWMGSKDPTFLPKLKIAWDMHFKSNSELILIISGSNSLWIQENILSSTGFFGRVSLRILLKELSLGECNSFWDSWPGISSYEKFKLLSVMGGVPRYLEELRQDLSSERNLQRLCFTKEGLLFNEFDQIFHDLFLKEGAFYKEIVLHLVTQNLSISDLAKKMHRSTGGDLTRALDALVESGFLARDFTWSLSTQKKLGINRYRVSDNYCRFYVRYILPYREQIEINQHMHLPFGWYSILGLQFENLVINNGSALCKCLEIPFEEIVFAYPYFQTKTTRRAGCQIDYMIQTRFKNLYVCEIKFSENPIGYEVIESVQKKLQALKLPKGFSIRPILVHVNGVDPVVYDSGFFAKIIDFSELLHI